MANIALSPEPVFLKGHHGLGARKILLFCMNETDFPCHWIPVGIAGGGK